MIGKMEQEKILKHSSFSKDQQHREDLVKQRAQDTSIAYATPFY